MVFGRNLLQTDPMVAILKNIQFENSETVGDRAKNGQNYGITKIVTDHIKTFNISKIKTKTKILINFKKH